MKKKLLMVVFNAVESDGRVLRCADSLSKICDLTLLSYNSSDDFISNSYNHINFRREGASIFNLVRFYIKIFSVVILNKPNLLYLHDYYLPIVGAFFKILFNKDFIYDAHELIIPSRRERNSIRKKIFYCLEKFSVKKAFLVISTNYQRMKILESVYKLKNIIYIQNISINTNCNNFIKSKNNKKKIIYQGVVSRSRGIFKFLEILEALPAEYSLTIIGSGPDVEEFKETIVSNSRVSYVPGIPNKELIDYLSGYDIGIMYYPKAPLNNKYCAPNKIYEYVQAGLIVVSSDHTFLKNIINQYKLGITVDFDNFSPENIADAINVYIEDNKKNREIDEFFSENNWINESAKLIKAVKKCLY